MDPRALGALALVLLVGLALAAYHFWSGSPGTVRAPAVQRPVAAPATASHALPSGAGPTSPTSGVGGGPVRELVVDVVGEVRRPGIHRLPQGARVTDALEAAGGVLRGASTRGLNRARLLADGEQIVVPEAGASGGPGGEGGVNGPPDSASSSAAGGVSGAAGVSGGAGAGQGAPAGPVSLNTATEQQLDTLPGVGPVLARHIIEFRTQHGGFRSVDQLREVTGIGERRFADLRPLVQP